MPFFFIIKQLTFHWIKISINFVSIMRKHQRKLIPIIDIIKGSLELTRQQVEIQEQVNRGIIQQLIQTDMISSIKQPSTLKLIIYEFILHFCQQPQNTNQPTQQNTETADRIFSLLVSIKELLNSLIKENEQMTLKSIDLQNFRHGSFQEKSYQNKYRVLTSYFNQYCSLINQKDLRTVNYLSDKDSKKQEKQQALINQLESLVYKKDEQLKSTLAQNKLLNNRFNQILEQIQAYRGESQTLQEDLTNMNRQNQELKKKIRDIMKNKEEPTILETQQEPTFKRYVWPPENKEKIEQELGLLADVSVIKQLKNQEELLKMIVSQALTIEALLN